MGAHITVSPQNTPLFEEYPARYSSTYTNQTNSLVGREIEPEHLDWGYWEFVNSAHQAKAREHGFFSPEEVFSATTFAIRHRLNQVPSTVIPRADHHLSWYDLEEIKIVWVPGRLDGTKGLKNGLPVCAYDHMREIRRRRRYYGLGHTITAKGPWVYTGTHFRWYLEPNADLRHVKEWINSIPPENLHLEEPTAENIVAGFPEWRGRSLTDDALGFGSLYNMQADQMYLKAADRRLKPDAYLPYSQPPHRSPDEPSEDRTSYHPAMEGAKRGDFVDLCNTLNQKSGELKLQERWLEPPAILDADGEPMHSPRDSDQIILDYPHLPIQISRSVEWWQQEALARLDPRIRPQDLDARKKTAPQPVKKRKRSERSRPQQRRSRNRTPQHESTLLSETTDGQLEGLEGEASCDRTEKRPRYDSNDLDIDSQLLQLFDSNIPEAINAAAMEAAMGPSSLPLNNASLAEPQMSVSREENFGGLNTESQSYLTSGPEAFEGSHLQMDYSPVGSMPVEGSFVKTLLTLSKQMGFAPSSAYPQSSLAGLDSAPQQPQRYAMDYSSVSDVSAKVAKALLTLSQQMGFAPASNNSQLGNASGDLGSGSSSMQQCQQYPDQQQAYSLDELLGQIPIDFSFEEQSQNPSTVPVEPTQYVQPQHRDSQQSSSKRTQYMQIPATAGRQQHRNQSLRTSIGPVENTQPQYSGLQYDQVAAPNNVLNPGSYQSSAMHQLSATPDTAEQGAKQPRLPSQETQLSGLKNVVNPGNYHQPGGHYSSNAPNRLTGYQPQQQQYSTPNPNLGAINLGGQNLDTPNGSARSVHQFDIFQQSNQAVDTRGDSSNLNQMLDQYGCDNSNQDVPPGSMNMGSLGGNETSGDDLAGFYPSDGDLGLGLGGFDGIFSGNVDAAGNIPGISNASCDAGNADYVIPNLSAQNYDTLQQPEQHPVSAGYNSVSDNDVSVAGPVPGNVQDFPLSNPTIGANSGSNDIVDAGHEACTNTQQPPPISQYAPVTNAGSYLANSMTTGLGASMNAQQPILMNENDVVSTADEGTPNATFANPATFTTVQQPAIMGPGSDDPTTCATSSAPYLGSANMLFNSNEWFSMNDLGGDSILPNGTLAGNAVQFNNEESGIQSVASGAVENTTNANITGEIHNFEGDHTADTYPFSPFVFAELGDENNPQGMSSEVMGNSIENSEAGNVANIRQEDFAAANYGVQFPIVNDNSAYPNQTVPLDTNQVAVNEETGFPLCKLPPLPSFLTFPPTGSGYNSVNSMSDEVTGRVVEDETAEEPDPQSYDQSNAVPPTMCFPGDFVKGDINTLGEPGPSVPCGEPIAPGEQPAEDNTEFNGISSSGNPSLFHIDANDFDLGELMAASLARTSNQNQDRTSCELCNYWGFTECFC